jgi:hypothetical protein
MFGADAALMTDALASDIAHLYRRAGFGAEPADVAAGVRRGYEATVEWLLAGLSTADPAGDAVPRPQLSAPPGSGAGARGRYGGDRYLLTPLTGVDMGGRSPPAHPPLPTVNRKRPVAGAAAGGFDGSKRRCRR